MLKKRNRLTRAQFNQAFSIGKRHHTPTLQCIVAQSDVFHGSVVIGKKVYKKAVDRNRLRRQLYAILYQWNKSTPQKRTVIMVVKTAVKDVPHLTLVSDCKEILEKISKV